MVDDAPQNVTLNEITQELDIEYPCRWVYKVLGSDETSIRGAVLEVIDLADVTLELSNKSSSGNFVSVNVGVTVTDHEQRVALYDGLRGHDAVRMVL
jgi:hypothetical protein